MNTEKATLELTEKFLSAMKKAEVYQFGETIQQIHKFRKGEITLTELDSWLLFTPRKVKEAVYQVTETMTPHLKSIRGLIEPGFLPGGEKLLAEMEKEDLEAVYQGVLKQARERKK